MDGLLAVSLPRCISMLACKGVWREIGLLGRWGSVFEAWPPEQWRESREFCHAKASSLWGSVPPGSLVTPVTFGAVAAELRGLAANPEVGDH
eukprot:3236162-Alexandrium_andersonii.AAC.1